MKAGKVKSLLPNKGFITEKYRVYPFEVKLISVK